MAHFNGIWIIIALHYGTVIFTAILTWSIINGTSNTQHAEIIQKIIGAYCFLVGTLAIPVCLPIFSPFRFDTDPSIKTLPIEPVRNFELNLWLTLILSFIMLIPIAIASPFFRLALNQTPEILDIIPPMQGIVAAVWVFFLMEVAGSGGDFINVFSRRLTIIAVFIFLHVSLVGLLSQISFPIIQNNPILKLMIDLNPFSQFYILLTGTSQNRLIVNTDIQRFLDTRLYLFLINAIITALAVLIYRVYLTSKYPKEQFL